jgi:CubicO group peptidase (beta-lactamase class C family)
MDLEARAFRKSQILSESCMMIERAATRPAGAIPLLLVLVTGAAIAWLRTASHLREPDNIPAALRAENIKVGVISVRQSDGTLRSKTIGKDAPTGTVFPIASLSKPLTALAIMRLIEAKHFDLDTKLATLLPETQEAVDPKINEITVRHLLQHSSGLGPSLGDPLFERGRPVGCARAIEVALQYQLVSSPGESTRYSNTGYCLLGAVIERVTKLDYASAMRLLIPEMTATLMLGPPNRLEYSQYEEHEWRYLGAAGGWFSDAESLVSILGVYATNPEIPDALQTAPESKNSNYGLGWRVWRSRCSYYLTHFGSVPGMFSAILAFPDGRAAVLLTRGGPRVPDDFAAKTFVMLRSELGEPPSSTECPNLPY